MKDLSSNWLIKWMQKKGIPSHKGYEYIGYLGYGCFFLALLPSILVQNAELSGWQGKLCGVLLLLITICLLVISGYCIYQANGMWMMLLLFGLCNIIMGLAIDLGVTWCMVFTVLGIVMTGIGAFLPPKQLRNSKKLKPELEAAQRQWQKEQVIRFSQTQKRQRQISNATKAADPMARSSEIDQLKIHLHVLKNGKESLKTAGGPERLKEAQEKYDAAAKKLGEKLLEQRELWVLVCRFQGAQPVYMGTDGRMEVFTDHALAQAGQKVLLERLNVETDIRALSGPDAIRSFFADCAHKGFQVLRLDNGSKFMCELWLREFFPYREENLIDEKNRCLRNLFHRAKLYSWLLAKQKDRQSPQGRGFAEMMLTMQLNGYREFGNTLVYALGNPVPEEKLCATQAALDKMREWLPGSGYEESTIVDTPAYEVELQLGFVNRPGEQGNMEKVWSASLRIFTRQRRRRRCSAEAIWSIPL